MEKSVILLSLFVLVWNPPGLSAGVDQAPDFCKLFPPDGSEPSCYAYIPQFFYNSTSQECEVFIYGGCGGNSNRFESKKKCMETCKPQPILSREVKMPVSFAAEACALPRSQHRIENACDQPAEPGPCLGYNPQFFYNATSKKCEIFIYGGCRGNRNRFDSMTTCQMYCRAVPAFNSTEVCNLAPETGPCKAAFQRLYYNPQSKRCEPFIYGGCDGNDNRFDALKDCMRMCHPEGNAVLIPLLPKAGVELGRKSDACILPPETGPCRAYIPRYFYNSTSHKCEQFIYGGCGGNNNRFVSARECSLSCSHKATQPTATPTTDSTETCHLPPDTGRCDAFIPRYYYNHKTQKCEEFVYGGCNGNQNNFIDEMECMNKCKRG